MSPSPPLSGTPIFGYPLYYPIPNFYPRQQMYTPAYQYALCDRVEHCHCSQRYFPSLWPPPPVGFYHNRPLTPHPRVRAISPVPQQNPSLSSTPMPPVLGGLVPARVSYVKNMSYSAPLLPPAPFFQNPPTASQYVPPALQRREPPSIGLPAPASHQEPVGAATVSHKGITASPKEDAHDAQLNSSSLRLMDVREEDAATVFQEDNT